MERRRRTRPPVRSVRTAQSRPAQRRNFSAKSTGKPPVRRRKKKPRIDITLTILDFFANIGRGIKRGYLRARKMRYFRAISSFAAIIFVTLTAAFIFYMATRPNALEVYLDEVPIGAVRFDRSREITLEYIMLHTFARLETQLGSNVRLVSEIEANPVRLGMSSSNLTFDNLVTALIDRMDYQVWGAIIVVDGAHSVTLPSSDAAESLLTDIAQSLRQGGGVLSFHDTFAEDIEIVRRYVTREQLMTRDDAYAVLMTPREVPGIHIIQSGDTFWGIEQATGMSVSDIAAANPDVNPLALEVGQRIMVVRTVPTLSARNSD